MSLIDLAQEFRNSAQSNGSITLGLQALTLSGGNNVAEVLADLQSYLGLEQDSLVIENLQQDDIPEPSSGQPENQPFSINAGTTTFLNIQMNVVSLRFELVDDALLIVLQTDSFPEDWDLGTSFLNLKVLTILNGHLHEPSFLFASDEKEDWEVTTELRKTLERGLNFYARIDLSEPVGAFEIVTGFLEFAGSDPASNQYLFGPIDLTNPSAGGEMDYPDLRLSTAVLSQKEIPPLFGFLKIKSPTIGMRVSEFEVVDPRGLDPAFEEANPEMYFQFIIDLDEIELNFSTSLRKTQNFFIFQVTSSEDLSPAQLFQLMAGNDWLGNIPVPLQKALASIKFIGFTMKVFRSRPDADGPPFKLSSISASVGSGQSLQSLEQFKDFDFTVQWTILNPLVTSQKQSLLSFNASVDWDELGTFKVNISGS